MDAPLHNKSLGALIFGYLFACEHTRVARFGCSRMQTCLTLGSVLAPELRAAFFAADKQAQALAQLRLKTNPNDTNALFAMALSFVNYDGRLEVRRSSRREFYAAARNQPECVTLRALPSGS